MDYCTYFIGYYVIILMFSYFRELEVSVDLNILQGKIEKTRLDLDHFSAGNAESQSKLASLKYRLAELENVSSCSNLLNAHYLAASASLHL